MKTGGFESALLGMSVYAGVRLNARHMPDWLAVARAFIEWFRAPYKTMFAIWILLAITLRSSVRTLVAGAFWFVTSFLILCAVEWVGRRIFIWRYLQHLADDERRVFHTFIVWDSKTHGFIASAVTASAMASIGLLEARDPNYKNPNDTRGLFYFTVKTWVFLYLQRHPQLIKLRNPQELGKGAIGSI